MAGVNKVILIGNLGADPEVNNFGSNNVGRFVDLAPFPPTKNVSFGIDFGF